MHQQEAWNAAREVSHALSRCYEPAMSEEAERLGLPAPDWNLLLAALTFEPDPISEARLRIRSPYTAPGRYTAQLGRLKAAAVLSESPLGGYTLTPRGREAATSLMSVAYDRMSALRSLQLQHLDALRKALGRIVQACLLTADPIPRWSIIYSRRLDRSAEAAVIAKMDQYISDLASFRDDAHLASWQHHRLTGHAWDVLTAIWREHKCTSEDTRSALSRREWSAADTEAAIGELLERSWVSRVTDLGLTDEGKEVRETAERRTDDYFFAPWAALQSSELALLRSFLPAVAEALGRDCA